MLNRCFISIFADMLIAHSLSYKVTFTLPPCARFIEILIAVAQKNGNLNNSAKGNQWGMVPSRESNLRLSYSTLVHQPLSCASPGT